jgi:hypothetical protein
MDDFRRPFLLSALVGLAGAASLAFAPALTGVVLPAGSAADVLRAVATARPALSHPSASLETGRNWRS